MIVKNESKIITRFFDSVSHIIDSYCICDTGSTDDTVKIIKPTENKVEVTPTVQKIVNVIPKITNNHNIKKIISQIITNTKENNETKPIEPVEKKNLEQNKEVKSNPKVRIDTSVIRPQNKEEIDKKRQEFENILLYTPNGKKQIKPTPPKNIGISI